MASGDTEVKICNKALLLLGAESITSFTDGSTAGNACGLIYPDVKATTLGMYAWSFTIAKKELNRDVETPNSEWTYQFTMPNDMLTGVPRAVRASSTAGSPLITTWDMGTTLGGYSALLTNQTTIFIDYQRSVEEGNMPSYFTQLLTYQLAWHLAEVMTDQTAKSEYWRGVALGVAIQGYRGGFFRQAVNIDSAGQTPSVIQDYLLTDVR
ncbi:hypothetical protein OAD30_03735 [Alphaproteobacteria bacterium]|nr:hypothetical protein [Alphaproteobacteria bacterium]